MGKHMNSYIEKNRLVLFPDEDFVAARIDELRGLFMNELKAHPDEPEVILDVKGIEMVDSMGVNLVIGLYREVASKSRTFRVTNAGEKFMKISSFFKFPQIFNIEEGE